MEPDAVLEMARLIREAELAVRNKIAAKQLGLDWPTQESKDGGSKLEIALGVQHRRG